MSNVGCFQILPPCEVPALDSGCSQWSGGRPWTWQPSGSRVVHTAGKNTRRGGLVLGGREIEGMVTWSKWMELYNTVDGSEIRRE